MGSCGLPDLSCSLHCSLLCHTGPSQGCRIEVQPLSAHCAVLTGPAVCADVKNRRGKNAKGRKITGMQWLPGYSTQLLITSNDSRIRLYEGAPATCLLTTA